MRKIRTTTTTTPPTTTTTTPKRMRTVQVRNAMKAASWNATLDWGVRGEIHRPKRAFAHVELSAQKETKERRHPYQRERNEGGDASVKKKEERTKEAKNKPLAHYT